MTKTRALAGADQVGRIADLLAAQYPAATVELDFENPYQLLVATILAAQSSDRAVNGVTPALFARYPDATALAAADPAELEPLVHSTGFYRMKAKYLIGAARAIVERHAGEVPSTMAELCALPGVARKTANVVLGCAFGKNEGLVVDLHVIRLAERLRLSAHADPPKIEDDLARVVARERWTSFAHGLIWHGRRVCKPTPDCEHCTLAPECPSAFAVVRTPRPARVKVGAKAKPKAKAAARPRAKAKPDARAPRTKPAPRREARGSR